MRRFESTRYDPEDYALRIQEGAASRLPAGFVVTEAVARDRLDGAEIELEARTMEFVGGEGERRVRIVVEAMGLGEAEDLLLRILDPITDD